MSKERGKALLSEAYKLINGERQDDYGNPEDSFAFIAKLWTAYLENACCSADGFLRFIKPSDVANMMILLKIARGNKHDNFVDICGYSALADSMQNGGDENKENKGDDDDDLYE